MNSNGVPQKINRHVYKAVHFYMNLKNGSTFPEIFNYVKLCNKNLIPVSNLKEAVRRSLNALHRVGLVQKNQQTYKVLPGIQPKKTPADTKKKKEVSSESKESCVPPRKPGKAKKRKISETSTDSESDGNTTKRLRGGKQKAIENRKGKRADLPRARRKQAEKSNIPITNAPMDGLAESQVGFSGEEAEDDKSKPENLLDENEARELDGESSNIASQGASQASLNKRSASNVASACALGPSQYSTSQEPNNNSATD